MLVNYLLKFYWSTFGMSSSRCRVFRDKNFTFSQKRRTEVTRNKQTRDVRKMSQ